MKNKENASIKTSRPWNVDIKADGTQTLWQTTAGVYSVTTVTITIPEHPKREDSFLKT